MSEQQKREDGGAAFPSVSADGRDENQGMTLRDYFAGQALAGHLASYSGAEVGLPEPRRAAKWAYEYADALLAERAR